MSQSRVASQRTACVHTLVEQCLTHYLNAPAVEFNGQALTYSELNVRADHLAAHLRERGVGPDRCVAICLERSFEMVVSVLAILKAGGAYVPLDPRYPAERLTFMLRDSKASVLLTQRKVARDLPSFEAPVLFVDEFDWSAPVEPTHSTGSDPVGESLAYVIYTSGSTGRPKGVAMRHDALVNLLEWQAAQFPAVPSPARTLQFTSLSFDVSFQEIFSTWCSGGTLVLMPEEMRYDPSALWKYLCEQRIDRLFLPFIALQHLAEAAAESEKQPDRLREIITAGEQLQITPKIRSLFQRLQGATLHNHYGPSETHVVTAYTLPPDVESWPVLPPIGRPIANTDLYVLDEAGNVVPKGETGELYIGGKCLARGYLGRPDLTDQRFVPSPFEAGARLYRTGDLVRCLDDGNLQFIGRIDGQIKIRGHRVELGEIEAVLGQHPGVRACAVAARGEGAEKHLVAYVVLRDKNSGFDPAPLRAFIKQRLSDYMIPSTYFAVETLPLTPSGKIDRGALPVMDQGAPPASRRPQIRGSIESALVRIWQDILNLPAVGMEDSFFDIGGNSLLLARVQKRIQSDLGREVSIMALFQYPTISALTRFLTDYGTNDTKGAASGIVQLGSRSAEQKNPDREYTRQPIAIVGMAGRFPGARNIAEFWANLCAARECLKRFSDEELRAAGIGDELLADPAYVRVRGYLDDADLFDASFFGITRRDAEITDPQQRLFLETAWEALEDAGCNPDEFSGKAGVYAGSSMNTYFLGRVMEGRGSIDEFLRAFQADRYDLLVGNDKDYLSTRVAYKLNLRGPAISVQTACSTSLVAVCQACAGLRSGQCDLAIAGGVSISFPQERGYLYQEGAIPSADGHCRAFDASAAGTVFGAGVAVVVLKRLSDAISAGDHVYAVIRGAATNNDGSDKVSFSAPSISGQAEVVRMAIEDAGVAADTIGYVEAHGTGTPLGDPIEVAALTQAFRKTTARTGFCALGSVKTNIGHIEAAAGVTGLIKAALAIHHGSIPPTLHFKKPNPKCDFAGSPFFVADHQIDWPASDSPRRAGVSSFGVGGTNAHVILEQAPTASVDSNESPTAQLLVWSARTPSALEKATENLAAWFEANSDVSLADAAFTLQTGRKGFSHRRLCVASTAAEAAGKLRSGNSKWIVTRKASSSAPQVVFLFPGQGSQYVGMGIELYKTEKAFRETVDACAERLHPIIGLDLRTVLYPSPENSASAKEQLNRTSVTQPALFVVEYALAHFWISSGITPSAMAGHSLGEYVAAVVAGVMSLEDGLDIVAQRARLMQDLPPGCMLSVRLSESDLRPLLNESLTLAAVNSPRLCTVAGPEEAVAQLEETLSSRKVACKRLMTSHAFHSAAVDPILGTFRDLLQKRKLSPARVPIVSTLTGRWIEPELVTDPEYWVRQLREPVRFADAVATLAQQGNWSWLEVGPGQTLISLAQQHPARSKEQAAVPSLPASDDASDREAFLMGAGKLWAEGLKLNWSRFHAGKKRRRISLPTYPFERQRYWIERANQRGDGQTRSSTHAESLEIETIESNPHRSLSEEMICRQLAVMREQLAVLGSAAAKPPGNGD